MKFVDNTDMVCDPSVLTFGVHKGTSIYDVPDDYVLFLHYKFNKDSKWWRLADAEYTRRKLSPETVAISFGKYTGFMIADLPDDYLKWCVLALEKSPLYPLFTETAEDRGLDLG